MKRALFCISMLVLALSSSFMASADDGLQLDSSLIAQDTANSMTWPMLPGESVNDVARLFYPKSSAMQQRFVTKTLRLNADVQLKPNQRFESPTLLMIPTLKSLSNKNVSQKKSNNQILKMSYGLKRVIQLAPEKLLQEYEELVSKNAFLKEQLVKLNEKIVLLQAKLDNLKLIFDKTLNLANIDLPVLPSTDLPVLSDAPSAPASLPTVAVVDESIASQAAVKQANVQKPAKKVFKNLNEENPPATLPTAEPVAESTFLDTFNVDALNPHLVKAILAAAALLLLGAFLFKKYRERMIAKLSFAATKMQNTVTDFSGYFEGKSIAKEEVNPEVAQHIKAAKEVEIRLSATLEEARLLMSVNRATDAIAHLKATIASQPKASINHWLYLLEVFRKLNMKDEFEQHASGLHQTFNVMTPVWYEMSVAIYVPQSLEEFPHIMEQLYGVWPGELASVYLRSLISDNRGGDRVGFGKEVVGEILFLIELLDTHKELPH